MPEIKANGVRLHYFEAGEGSETIVFSHGLLMSGDMYSGQIEKLSGEYRCIAYDHRGQGKSQGPETGYDMDTVTEDAKALIKALGAAPCHFVGLSMGGFVGLRLASRHPELLRSLILLETSADPEPADSRRKYNLLALIARWFGLRIVINRVMAILFGATFMNDPLRGEERKKWSDHIVNCDIKSMLKAVAGVTKRDGVHAELGRISMPTLIVVGDEDAATPLDKAERIAAGIHGSQLVKIPRAGHSSSIEQPEAVTHAIEFFLSNLKRESKTAGLAKPPKPPQPPKTPVASKKPKTESE
jgi:pimeloyl-ACP methyl ester carboxylesterase